MPGFIGVALSYVVWSQASPDRTTDFQGDFIALTISCIPLSGNQFQADTRKVHQLLKNYLEAETAEQWISSIEKSANGRDNFDTLFRHCSAKGNVRRGVATSDLFQETLHYNINSSFSFNTFLDRMQKIFNIFHDKEEPMANRTQVNELFRRV